MLTAINGLLPNDRIALIQSLDIMLFNQLVVNLILHCGERLFAGFLMFLNLDDMEAVARVNQKRDIAWLSLFDRGCDLIVQVIAVKLAQLPTLALRIIVRVLASQLTKVLA